MMDQNIPVPKLKITFRERTKNLDKSLSAELQRSLIIASYHMQHSPYIRVRARRHVAARTCDTVRGAAEPRAANEHGLIH